MADILNKGDVVSLEDFSRLVIGIPSSDIKKVFDFIKENGGIETYSKRIDLSVFVSDEVEKSRDQHLQWNYIKLSNGKYFQLC